MPRLQSVTSEIAKTAINLVEAAIIDMFRLSLTKRPTICIVVLVSDETGKVCRIVGNGRQTWEKDYEEFASGKAYVSERTGLDSRVVAFTQPWLLQPGDIKYGGGVYREGVVVGASGNEWYYDQLFAEWVASAIQALIRADVQKVLDDPGQDALPA